jgi:hypothetical protein
MNAAWVGQPLLTAAAFLWAAILTWGGRYGGWFGRASTGSVRG